MNRRTMERGLGFTSVRERLRIVCGTMNINSSPSHGTRLEVSIPLNGDI
jgi:signal transduction histidine kinase